MVLAMIRDLPGHSRWHSWVHDPDRGAEFREAYGLDDEVEDGGDESQEDAPVDWYEDSRMWPEDRVLYAAIINRLQQVIEALPVWPEGKRPDFPTVGPARWRGEEPHKKEEKPPKKETSVADVLAVFGYTGPTSIPSEPVADEGADYDGATVSEVMSVFGFRGSA
jgi:hypothetical protein